jgi:hypothetical protein
VVLPHLWILPHILAGLPVGVIVAPGRIEVQFAGAREAVARLSTYTQIVETKLL